jgi:hypothetical protein
MINFQTFLQSLHNSEFWNSTPCFYFQGQEFPSLFFASLFELIVKKNILPAPLQRLPLHTTTKAGIQANLAQSFLGSCNFYWLGHLDESQKWHKEFGNELCLYKGPNVIAFFAQSDLKVSGPGSIQIIQIEPAVNFEQFNLLQAIFGNPLPEKKVLFIKKLFKLQSSISLDTACMLINYIDLISLKMIPQSEKYLLDLVSSQPSLTQLSEYFFAQNPEKFFDLWITLQNDYPDIFWITFWSEQIWRALNVIQYLNKKDFINAKKMSFRLPYSFLKKDWQLYTKAQLAKLFKMLYSADYTLKRGSTFPALDIFYVSHFQSPSYKSES